MADAAFTPEKPEPSGIGGWLILPAIGTAITPFLFLKTIVDLLTVIGGPNFSRIGAAHQTFVWCEVLVNFLLMCGWAAAIYLMLKQRRRYPLLFGGLVIASLVATFADIVIAAAAFSIPVVGSDFGIMARQMAICLIWIPYMMSSQRVKNTFVN